MNTETQTKLRIKYSGKEGLKNNQEKSVNWIKDLA